MAAFRKKPVTIEAVQYTGQNAAAIRAFTAGPQGTGCGGMVTVNGEPHLHIHTLEGVMRAAPGDWIIKGVAGEFYPCKPDIFARTYELVAQ